LRLPKATGDLREAEPQLKIVFHIFKKDVRHHWPEILASLVVLAVFTWDQPRQWEGHVAANRILSILLGALPSILVVAWIFLLVRVAQGESLVGDRQFWTTRPYTRTKLFAAKLLTALVFVHTPLFISQLIVLKLAFFPVLASIPGLLFVHSMLFITLVMYAFALGSVTPSIGKATLGVLAVAVAMIGVGSLFAIFPSMDFTSDFFGAPLGLLLAATGTVVTLAQYIFRKTLLSISLFGAAVLLMVALMLLSTSSRIADSNLPLPTTQHPLPAKFAFDHDASFGHEPGQKYYGKSVFLEFPFLIQDLADNTVAQIHGAKLDLDLPTGERWTSGWNSAYDDIESGRTRSWVSFDVKRAVFDPIRNRNVKAHVSFAVRVYRVGKSSALSFQGDKLHFAEGSRCTIDVSGMKVKCFSALKEPGGFVIYTDLPNSDCPPVSPEEERQPWASLPATYTSFRENSDPDLSFGPIQQFELTFSRRHIYEDSKTAVPVCPSTKLLVATTKFQYTTRAEIDLGEVKLANYVPTYPRKIVPPIDRPSYREPSDTLSFNLLPRPLAEKPQRLPP
jgi:hypothetical protein